MPLASIAVLWHSVGAIQATGHSAHWIETMNDNKFNTDNFPTMDECEVYVDGVSFEHTVSVDITVGEPRGYALDSHTMDLSLSIEGADVGEVDVLPMLLDMDTEQTLGLIGVLLGALTGEEVAKIGRGLLASLPDQAIQEETERRGLDLESLDRAFRAVPHAVDRSDWLFQKVAEGVEIDRADTARALVRACARASWVLEAEPGIARAYAASHHAVGLCLDAGTALVHIGGIVGGAK